MKLRSDYKDEFQKKHDVKLGLMSGFVKVKADHAYNLYKLITYLFQLISFLEV
jgi:pyruvate/2-oxoglutarate dehydrogenase complex dihydrolipoamide acyltransferase (E2) component